MKCSWKYLNCLLKNKVHKLFPKVLELSLKCSWIIHQQCSWIVHEWNSPLCDVHQSSWNNFMTIRSWWTFHELDELFIISLSPQFMHNFWMFMNCPWPFWLGTEHYVLYIHPLLNLLNMLKALEMHQGKWLWVFWGAIEPNVYALNSLNGWWYDLPNGCFTAESFNQDTTHKHRSSFHF